MFQALCSVKGPFCSRIQTTPVHRFFFSTRLNIYIVDLKNKNLTLQNQLLKANKKDMRKHQQIFSLKSKIKAEHKKTKG
jgi:hypothetical protein